MPYKYSPEGISDFCLQEDYLYSQVCRNVSQDSHQSFPKLTEMPLLRGHRSARLDPSPWGTLGFSFGPQCALKNVIINFNYFLWSSRALITSTVEQARSESKLLHTTFRHISGIYFDAHKLSCNHFRCSPSYFLSPFLSPHETLTVALSFMGWGNEGRGGTSRNF